MTTRNDDDLVEYVTPEQNEEETIKFWKDVDELTGFFKQHKWSVGHTINLFANMLGAHYAQNFSKEALDQDLLAFVEATRRAHDIEMANILKEKGRLL